MQLKLLRNSSMISCGLINLLMDFLRHENSILATTDIDRSLFISDWRIATTLLSAVRFYFPALVNCDQVAPNRKSSNIYTLIYIAALCAFFRCCILIHQPNSHSHVCQHTIELNVDGIELISNNLICLSFCVAFVCEGVIKVPYYWPLCWKSTNKKTVNSQIGDETVLYYYANSNKKQHGIFTMKWFAGFLIVSMLTKIDEI